jgi:hypothetical protein
MSDDLLAPRPSQAAHTPRTWQVDQS